MAHLGLSRLFPGRFYQRPHPVDNHRAEEPLAREIEQLERRMAQLAEEKQRIDARLADPATYEDVPLSRELGQRFAALQNRAEELMSDLAYLEKELQELEIQRDA